MTAKVDEIRKIFEQYALNYYQAQIGDSYQTVRKNKKVISQAKHSLRKVLMEEIDKIEVYTLSGKDVIAEVKQTFERLLTKKEGEWKDLIRNRLLS